MNKNFLFKIFNNCAINKDQANKNILKNSSFESSFNSVPLPQALLNLSNQAKEGCFSPKVGLEKKISANLPSILLQSQPQLLKQREEDNKNINNPIFINGVKWFIKT